MGTKLKSTWLTEKTVTNLKVMAATSQKTMYQVAEEASEFYMNHLKNEANKRVLKKIIKAIS